MSPLLDFRPLEARDPDVARMLRVQQDDTWAFRELVERYHHLVFGRLFRKLGDRQLAEDLTQEAFLRLYRNRKRYRPQAKFATWLFHITENLFRNALRSRKRRLMLPLDGFEQPVMAYSCRASKPSEAPSQPMERAELTHQVRQAIATLNNRQRAALELHEYQDRTYAEIAKEMRITPEAAKSLLYRARNQLRHCLTPLMEE